MLVVVEIIRLELCNFKIMATNVNLDNDIEPPISGLARPSLRS